jgi:hypothetical protein
MPTITGQNHPPSRAPTPTHNHDNLSCLKQRIARPTQSNSPVKSETPRAMRVQPILLYKCHFMILQMLFDAQLIDWFVCRRHHDVLRCMSEVMYSWNYLNIQSVCNRAPTYACLINGLLQITGIWTPSRRMVWKICLPYLSICIL